jgi:group I intron endonuclease
MFYTIYKTTNQINGKFYIGAHKTEDLNDNYLGSGKLLKKAIEKYGIDNFSKEILFVFETAEEMFAKEAELVTDEFLSENNTYNLKVGGFGGFDYINQSNITASRNRRIANKRSYKEHAFVSNNTGPKPWTSKNLKPKNWSGLKHTEESKRKISDKLKLVSVGEKNSQYGTMWINDGVVCKKIKKHEEIPTGWKRGRV